MEVNYSQELLLGVATTITGVGTTLLVSGKIWEGLAVCVVGCALFVARGFYKKYVGEVANRGK